MNEREMIEERCRAEGFAIQGWSTTDDGETAALGRYVVVTPEFEDDGLYEGMEGELSACVVGAEQYRNQRVSFSFMEDGMDSGSEVRELSAIDPVDA